MPTIRKENNNSEFALNRQNRGKVTLPYVSLVNTEEKGLLNAYQRNSLTPEQKKKRQDALRGYGKETDNGGL